jgi:hypothetical protein
MGGNDIYFYQIYNSRYIVLYLRHGYHQNKYFTFQSGEV